MLEGIEPTVSTIPLGSTNKIVSGDQPSTVSRNHPQHTISFSSKYDWIPCGVIATDSNHSLSFLSVNRNEGILVSLTYFGNFLGYPKAPSTPLYIKIPPTHPTHRFFHYERYISLLRQHDVLERHIFPHSVWVACSHSLIPETNLLAVTSAVYVWTLRLTHVP